MSLWKRKKRSSQAVRFMRTEKKPNATYHIHRGPDRAQALEFLRQTPVTEKSVYVVVETPEGNVGRDLIVLFEEKDGAVIEYAPRPRFAKPRPSKTHCAWCGHFLMPMEEPEIPGSATSVHVYHTLGEMKERGQGLQCENCTLLQCVSCTDTASGGKAGMYRCRSCSHQLGTYPTSMRVFTYLLQVLADDGKWGTLRDPRSWAAEGHGAICTTEDSLPSFANMVMTKMGAMGLKRRVVFFQGDHIGEKLMADEAFGVVEEGSTVLNPLKQLLPRGEGREGACPVLPAGRTQDPGSSGTTEAGSQPAPARPRMAGRGAPTGGRTGPAGGGATAGQARIRSFRVQLPGAGGAGASEENPAGAEPVSPEDARPAGMEAAGTSSEAAAVTDAPRHRPYRMSVSSPQVRVTVEPDGFVVEQALPGIGGATRWQTRLELGWQDIDRMEFATDHRRAVVSLYVHPVHAMRRHALDASHLSAEDWGRVADAVAANTGGRLTLDLSSLDGSRLNRHGNAGSS